MSKEDGSFNCTECGMSFRGKHTLARHQRIHTYLFPLFCTKCKLGFQKKAALKRHWQTHIRKKPYSCTECGRCYCRNDHLQRHQNAHTHDIVVFPCIECKFVFNRKDHLKRHQRTHNPERPYTCTECDQSFKRKEHLSRHQRRHSKASPLSCLLYKNVHNKKNQSRRNHRPPGSFNRHSDIVRQQGIYEAMPPKTLSCTHCDRIFSFQISLLRHQALHNMKCQKIESQRVLNGDTKSVNNANLEALPYSPFPFAAFNKCITIEESLVIQEAGSIIPYSCTVCERSFRQKWHLITHKRNAACLRQVSDNNSKQKRSSTGTLHRNLASTAQENVDGDNPEDQFNLAVKSGIACSNGEESSLIMNCNDEETEAAENSSNRSTEKAILESPNDRSRRVVLKAATFVFKSPVTVAPPTALLSTTLLEEAA